MGSVRIGFAGVLLSLWVAGCGAPQGPHVRFASASRGAIEAAQSSGQVVWYDFERGDEVPLDFVFVGVGRAVTEQPMRMVASRAFSIVVFPDGRTMFSFDGSSLVSAQLASRWSVALDADEQGGRAGFLLFIGQQEDLPAELRR